MNESRVWVRKRRLKSGKTTHHLRWLDQATGCWRSRKSGTDSRVAKREAVMMERELSQGTFQDVKRVSWQTFTDDVVSYLSGINAEAAEQVLNEFASVVSPPSPMAVRPAMLRTYVQWLRDKGNAVATVNKKIKYLRAAFNVAITLDYAAANPTKGWKFDKVPKHELRILGRDEESLVLASADKLYGVRFRVFIAFALETWGRLSELTGLRWADVRFDDGSVLFRDTKSHEDRFVPIPRASGLWGDLRRLQVQTMQDGGPFVVFAGKSKVLKRWIRSVKDAGIAPITMHDLRRTGITRALLANMPSVAVQAKAGHADIATTMKYYTEVSKNDLREAVERLAKLA